MNNSKIQEFATFEVFIFVFAMKKTLFQNFLLMFVIFMRLHALQGSYKF